MSSSGEWSSILGSSFLHCLLHMLGGTTLGEPGDGCALGVAGPKYKFSGTETWNSHGSWHRGVGPLELSLPLSYPISSKASSHSKVSFKVVTKQ